MHTLEIKVRLRSRISAFKDSALFFLNPPNWNAYQFQAVPFGIEGSLAFHDLVNRSNQYLEFGSGASTMAVAQTSVPMVVVESDSRFLSTVKRKCHEVREGLLSSRMEFLHGDIGPTGPWGKPIFPSVPRPKIWRNYPLAPWTALGSEFQSDLILVDGRFRVACALAVVLNQSDSDWALLFDDYADRPHYRPIESFAELVSMHGRMAEFRPKKQVSRRLASKAFEKFVSDWR